MRKVLLSILLFSGLFGLSSLSVGQEIDDTPCNKTADTVCNQTIRTSCARCHTTDRICHELGESDANWPEIVKEMAEKGNLSKKVQDRALKCLTKSADPKKFVCTK